MKTLLVFVPILVLIALLTIVITVFANNKRRSIGVTFGIFAYVIFGFFLAMAVQAVEKIIFFSDPSMD